VIYKFKKNPTHALECTNVILLYSNHPRVSTTHVAVFRLMRTRIQL